MIRSASGSRIDLLHLFPDCRGQRWVGKDSEGSRWGIMCNSPLMGSTAWEFLKRADSCRMREEADYPPSFCVWDQDQRVNPPLDEESWARGEDGQVGVRRARTISQKKKKKRGSAVRAGSCVSLQLIHLQTWQIPCNQVVTCVCTSQLTCTIMCMWLYCHLTSRLP